MRPPATGAKFLDPKVRNSHEIPRWLNAPETRERLAGKRVLMYCTGGIRCERASALLSELSSCTGGACPAQATQDAVAAAGPKEIVMVRGGVERYLRTFPDGGYWAGANYLFDRRFEQRPLKRQAPLGSCALCGVPCDLYRGRVVCAVATCKVPVLACQACRTKTPADVLAATAKCRLCRDNFAGARRVEKPELKAVAAPVVDKAPRAPQPRLFVGNLPFTAERDEVLAALDIDGRLTWLVDRETSLFYGSAVVECGLDAARKVVSRAKLYPTKLRGRKLRLGFGPSEAVEGPHGQRPPCARPASSSFPSNSEMTTLGPGLSRPLTRRPPARRPESNTAAPGDSTAHDARGPYPIGRSALAATRRRMCARATGPSAQALPGRCRRRSGGGGASFVGNVIHVTQLSTQQIGAHASPDQREIKSPWSSSVQPARQSRVQPGPDRRGWRRSMSLPGV